jgi:Spy/CpxP family protein refolding chaperone
MSLQRKLTGIGLTLGLALTFNVAAFAQEGAQQQDNGAQQQGPFGGRGGKRRGGGGGGRRGPGAMMRLMKQLNLSDAQQQQIHAIQERLQASVKPQREEMRRLRESSQGQPSADTVARIETLHTEMGRTMRATHEEILAVLTPEQRTQLEQLVRERKARHDERRSRRQDMPDDNDNQ